MGAGLELGEGVIPLAGQMPTRGSLGGTRPDGALLPISGFGGGWSSDAALMSRLGRTLRQWGGWGLPVGDNGAEIAADAQVANPGMTQSGFGGPFLMDSRRTGSMRVASAGNDAFGNGLPQHQGRASGMRTGSEDVDGGGGSSWRATAGKQAH